MAWVWNGWGLLHVASGAVSILLAALLWIEARGRLQNRALAGLLLVTGASWGARGLAMSMAEPQDAFGWFSVHFALWPAGAIMTLVFLGTLPSPLVRPIATPVARWTLIAAAVGLVVYWLVDLRAQILTGVTDAVFYAPWNANTSRGFVSLILFDIISLVAALLGLLVAVDLFRRAPAGSLMRRRAKAYLVAFGVTDGLNLYLFGVLAWLWHGGDWATWIAVFHKPAPESAWETVVWWSMGGGFAAAHLVFSILLAHAILRAQLFDIDLKIKWTIRRGTLVGVFLAAFFAASAIAQQYLEQFGVLAGGAAVGMLVFALRPIERVADRLAERAMPNVHDTPEYRAQRGRAVYRAAIEGALEDGDVTDRERAMLARLAEELSLGPREMHDIEREARAARAGVA